MIFRYRCDDGNQRRNHIRGIESATQSDLDDGHVDAISREKDKSHYCNKFEKSERDIRVYNTLPNFVGERDDFGLGNFFPADANSFCERLQMGRSIKRGSIASVMQNIMQQRRRGSLAVGASDV